MGKLLRVLTVLFLVVSIAALWLGILLFGKRELLKGRAQMLENTLISLARYIETGPAETEPGSFAAKDVSDCTAEALANPEHSEFWSGYNLSLEKPGPGTVDLNPRRDELMSYYLLDPVTGKIMRDSMGYRVTKGKGTMNDLLEEVLKKTEDQLKRLNDTRSELTKVREELVRTIEELNQRKGTLREKLAEIVRLNGVIADKDAQIAQLNKTVDELKADIQAKTDEILSLQQKIGELEEEVKDLKQEVARWRGIAEGKIAPGPDTSSVYRRIEPGEKGSVMDVNEAWDYVVLKLDDKFMDEFLAEKKSAQDRNRDFGPIELMLKRPDGSFVTKVMLMRIKREENIGIGDIESEWTIQPVQKGDILFY
jgi:prefoldin subunit 5